MEITIDLGDFASMSSLVLLHNPRCSKSREALAWLGDRVFTVRNYLEQPLAEDELQKLIECLEGPIRELVRVKDDAFMAAPFDVTDSATVARELARNPSLLERPVVMQGEHAVVARPLSRLEDWLARHA